MKRFIFTLVMTLGLVSSAYSAEIMVSAAASLTDAFTEIEARYEKLHPDTDVVMNFAASGPLYKQIEQGAPVDVFASANAKWMDKAVEQGFADKKNVTIFAQNSLVLAVPAGNPGKVGAVKDLTSAPVRMIAVGTPETVPAGQYAKAALAKLGMWDTLAPKFVYGESVRQVLDYLVRGEVDAAFVYGTDAAKGGAAVTTVEEIPLEKPVAYPAAVLNKAPNPSDAASFFSFLNGEEGREVLKKYGFKVQ